MLSKPVYEVLPYLYVGGGIAAMLLLDSVISFGSGLLMSVTGVLVLWLRRNHRQPARLRLEQNWQAE